MPGVAEDRVGRVIPPGHHDLEVTNVSVVDSLST